MENKLLYKVLWVDDQEFPALLTVAERYGIDITQVRCWTDAKPYLEEDHFDNWSALILDCYCSIEPNGPENEKFLREVFADFNRMQGKKRTLPWYVLSQGNKERFDQLMDLTLSEQRLKWDRNWEKGYYSKSAISISPIDGKEKPDYQIMLENIQKVAEQTVPNKVRAKYPEAFEAARYFGGKIEHDLLEFLVNDYKNDLTDTHRYYNWVRNIMEGIFNHGKEKKIFPPLNDTNGFGCLLDKGSTKDWKIINYESFIPKTLGHAASFLLGFTNEGCHPKTDNEVQAYVAETNNINLFRAMLYIEMDLLVWYHHLCKKVDDPQNADFSIGNLWKEPTPKVQLNHVQVKLEIIKEHKLFVVKKGNISVQLMPDKKISPSELKENVFVNVRDYEDSKKFVKIAPFISWPNNYDILYNNITVYDQNTNELKSDFLSGMRKAKVSGAGRNYNGLPHKVNVTPYEGHFIKDIKVSGICSDETKFEIINKYINATIDINELIEDLSFIVTTHPFPNLTISQNIVEGGTISSGGAKAPDSEVPISAIPNEGYEFVEWQGCEVKDKQLQKTTLTMPENDVSLVAIFKKKMNNLNPK